MKNLAVFLIMIHGPWAMAGQVPTDIAHQCISACDERFPPCLELDISDKRLAERAACYSACEEVGQAIERVKEVLK
jgi:hypothetical protein